MSLNQPSVTGRERSQVTTCVAYWCWTHQKLLCVPCWGQSGLSGQSQRAEDLISSERCADCGELL
jgi:hypothetical protein